ncbi:MAG: hypothetical protein ACI9E5_001062, partial [Candidatus Omnitrophota bacterium]
QPIKWLDNTFKLTKILILDSVALEVTIHNV